MQTFQTLLDTFGQQVHQQKIHSSETVINVSTWPPGIYVAEACEEGQVVGRSKLVVR